jgi:hypothetical protein
MERAVLAGRRNEKCSGKGQMEGIYMRRDSKQKKP